MQSNSDKQSLIDCTYAALTDECSWQDFLDQLRKIMPNGKALLFFHDEAAGVGAFALSSGFDQDSKSAYASHYSAINPWMSGACTRQLGQVVHADLMLPRANLTRTEFFNDFLRPQELHSGIGVTIFREQHCNFLLSILSADASEAVFNNAIRCVEALVPHLRRAFKLYRRGQSSTLGLFDGKGLSEYLSVGTITIGPGRKVCAISSVAGRLLEKSTVLSIDCAGRFRCTTQVVVDCIDLVLSQWMRDRRGVPPRTFLLRERDGAPPMRLTVIAPPGETEARFFRGAECVLLLEDTESDVESIVEDFGSLYNLSRAEKRVVAGLAAGSTPSEIAARAGTSPETVRKQLKQVFAKTGISRQADLVRNVYLLAGTFLNRSALAATITVDGTGSAGGHTSGPRSSQIQPQ